MRHRCRREFIDYVLAGLQEELWGRHDALETRLKTLRAAKKRIEIELARLVERIATGSGSASVMAAITEREARLREITNQAIEPVPGSLNEKLDELRTLRCLTTYSPARYAGRPQGDSRGQGTSGRTDRQIHFGARFRD